MVLMSTPTTDDIVSIKPVQHTGHDVYWVELHRTDGSVARAFPTYNMTDATILQENLVSVVKDWAAQL
jgi:hypothetical protein